MIIGAYCVGKVLECGSRGGGGAGGPDLPRKITSYIFSIGISNWNPHPGKSWTPPPPEECWTPSGTLKNDSFL